jgi:serine/threonine protein kinase
MSEWCWKTWFCGLGSPQEISDDFAEACICEHSRYTAWKNQQNLSNDDVVLEMLAVLYYLSRVHRAKTRVWELCKLVEIRKRGLQADVCAEIQTYVSRYVFADCPLHKQGYEDRTCVQVLCDGNQLVQEFLIGGHIYVGKTYSPDSQTNLFHDGAVQEIYTYQQIQKHYPNHPNFLRVHGIVAAPNGALTLFFEKIQTYEDIFQNSRSEHFVRHHFQTLVRAVHELHLLGIFHRDIKCANIGFRTIPETRENCIILYDFDSACLNNIDNGCTVTTRPICTASSRAPWMCAFDLKNQDLPHPEYKPYSAYNVDVWALGCVLLAMLTNSSYLFNPTQLDDIFPAFLMLLGKNHTRKFFQDHPRLVSRRDWAASSSEPNFPQQVFPEAASLLLQLLQMEPADAPASYEAILQHSFFRDSQV